MSGKQLSEKINLGQLCVADELASPLPLEHTTVAAQVIGPLAAVTVTQRFGNPLNHPVELDYLFPLPHHAAVVDFELRIGMRLVKGEIQELEEARKIYEAAREEGKRAGLLEQRRPNLFATRIANVLPGETILATLRYQERLKFEDGQFDFVFPMGVTPKYDSPAHPGEGQGTQVPAAGQNEPIGPVEITLAVDAGVPIRDPDSPSHPIEVIRLDERRCQVRLGGEQIPDHDFVLRYTVDNTQVASGAWVSLDQNGETFLATLIPPALGDNPAIPSREFVFVLDRSGSMSGEPIVQARNALRACLRALNLNDTFRILLFDDQLEWYKKEPCRVEQKEIDAADRFLASIEGRGGTEIVAAIEAALKLPEDRERTRFVVFLTDGAVSAEKRALEQARRQLGKARLFTFGIGPSVNRALLSHLATAGRGASEFLQLDEDIEGAIIRFQDRVSFPALTDLALEWQNARAWDVYPARLPDLYTGQPLEISGRLGRSGGAAALVVRGRLGDRVVELKTTLPEAGAAEPMIGRAWARARVDDLLEQSDLDPSQADQHRTQVISLAFEHRLVTPFTAFVAVDRDVVAKDARPQVLHVSQPLPAGLSYDALVPAAPVQLSMYAPSAPMPSSPPPAGSLRSQNILSNISQIAPAFMRRRSSSHKSGMGAGMVADSAFSMMESAPNGDIYSKEAAETAMPLETGEAALRSLARSQALDGSWNSDTEITAAALLAFVRGGHTTQTGSFRQAVRRAFEWLSRNPGQGFAAFARALALQALAQATRQEQHRSTAAQVVHALPAPTTLLENTVVDLLEGKPTPAAPAAIQTLDDLRLAGILGATAGALSPLPQPVDPDLARAWSACLK